MSRDCMTNVHKIQNKNNEKVDGINRQNNPWVHQKKKIERVEIDITEIIKKGTGKEPQKPVYVYELKDLTYPIKMDDYWKNWFMFAFSAFKKIAAEDGASHKVESFATIGTGPGVDAIGAVFCFNDLKKIIVTDLDRKITRLARRNVRKNAPSGLNIESYDGSICDPLLKRNIKLDLIYENLPNIPGTAINAEGYKTSSFFNVKDIARAHISQGIDNFQEIFDKASKYLLLTHLAALIESKGCLNKNGSLILSIGGRVPLDLIKRITMSVGYEFSEIISGFKIQTEPEDVLPEYSRLEKENSVTFDFYRYADAIQVLEKNNVKYPYLCSCGTELKTILETTKISATEAEELNRSGVSIGHTVHMFRALNR